MYLALRDLRSARWRFALVGTVIALVALLSGLLSGLATGLVDDGISGLRRLPLDHLVFSPGADGNFTRSMLGPAQLEAWDAELGADAAPLGVSFFNARTDSGAAFDVAMFATTPDSFLARDTQASDALREPGLVLSEELRDTGITEGDMVTIVGPQISLPVVGFTYAGSYGHVPIAFTSLSTWAGLVYGDEGRHQFSAIAVRDPGGADLDAIAQASQTEVMSKTAAFEGSPGYPAETATMTLIRAFLILISALVVGAFFTVWTVQRTAQIGLMKALGASTRYVIRDSVGQLAIVVVAATAAGIGAAALLGLAVGSNVPFRLTVPALVTTGVILVAAGLIGSVVALRRIDAVDPAIALNTAA